MILADKIIYHRKKNGWSQEELATMLGVSRQSISKYESAQSMPDLDKILKLSKIFGVSTDYLIKDEIEEADVSFTDEDFLSDSSVRKVSMEEASEFLAFRKKHSAKVALGVALCILSPVCLIFLSALAENNVIPENVAFGIGLSILVAFVACGVFCFITFGIKAKKYEYLEKEDIETEFGVSGMVKARKEQFQDTYSRNIVLGIILCIVSVIPLFIGLAFPISVFVSSCTVCILLVFVALGVFLIVKSGMPMGAFNQLLEEEDYTRESKAENRKFGPVYGVYWLLVTTVFLTVGFTQNNWHQSWIIWPVAGVFFPAFTLIVKAIAGNK